MERRREADPSRARRAGLHYHPFEALEAKHQMNTALVAGERVKLVDDDVLHRSKLLTKFRGGKQDEERFGGGNENVGRMAEHRTAFVDGRVTGAQSRANRRDR